MIPKGNKLADENMKTRNRCTHLLLTASLGLACAVRRAHCVRCHGPTKTKGDLLIDPLSSEFTVGAESHLWAEAFEKVNSGEYE